MSIIDETLLDRFRAKQRCELCGTKSYGCQPHHFSGRGIGGGRRFDVSINLISLCVECHQAVHFGNVSREEVLGVIAAREKQSPQAIQEELWRLRRI